MAVRHRVLNSTAPFSDKPQAELKGSYPSSPSPDEEAEGEQGKDFKMELVYSFKPMLTKLLTHGTAEQVGEGPLNCWKNSPFIAQAECETQDSQEFSPSCSERSYVASPNCFISSTSLDHNNVAYPTAISNQAPEGSPSQRTPRKKQRKRQKRKEKKKEEQRKGGKQRERRRVPSGVPEQESGTSPRPIQTQEKASGSHRGRSNNSTSCSSSIQEQDPRPPLYTRVQDYSRGPSRTTLGWNTDVCGLHSDPPTYGQDCDSDSPLSSVGDCTVALAGLRGCVSQVDSCYAGPFSRDVEKDVREKEAEDEDVFESDTNEGIILNENIQPDDYEYREGKEYFLSQFIKRGSYGEVNRAQDIKTGFKFAAKKIPLQSFNSEEVGTWSALKSPRVVELFGVVREGPFVILFMDLKSGSIGQLLAERGRLPEDLALHYHCQVLGALEHLLKRRVLHLDIKADNVLLSEDGKDTFLCDFGHSERLGTNRQSLHKANQDLKGTETHMAPEIVKGEPRGAKADVWSSCCMLLHMLNGCQPWTRYYSRPLYLKIADEPPPLREIPPDCSPFTAEVLKVGLQKEPIKRASASELKGKAARALREVGGLSSPIRGSYKEPLQKADGPPYSSQPSSSTHTSSDELPELWLQSMSPGRKRTELNKDDDGGGGCDEEEEEEANAEEKMSLLGSPLPLDTHHHDGQKHNMANVTSTVSELELRIGFYLSSLSELHSAEILMSCLSSDCHSNWELGDKKDSGRWSISPGDDLSSGVFSYNSQPDGQVISMDWLGHTDLPPPWFFEGVDICIRDFNGRSLRIRETRRVKVGHIATGISDQISERVFTMETQDRQPVPHDEEVQDSGLQLCCVPAPDSCPAWRWRIREGVLETRDPAF